ncbi:YbgC/FadM family acyl-CoA thioesterase [Aliikangiella maris]|uniref:YbgC/FadM family acyl-CoA thioesterase n=2 Tax=Aliikangiella maris TaxID=3162458 RepID=A0ABV3MQN8_9GAMM
MSTEFIWPVRVYFEDTDAGGVVYHANYLKYFERARTEWFNHLGIDQALLMRRNTVFAVGHIDIDFIKPARLNERLAVISVISKSKGASFITEQQLFRENDRENILCRANVQIVSLNLDSFTPCRLPAEVKEELQRVS